MIEAEPYVCLNVGSGTVEESRSWVEYCNASQSTALVDLRRENGHPEPYGVRFWGIGNESWGCGGSMWPEYYADLYRRFATYVRKTAGEGAKLIACGSHPQLQDWDERFLEAMRGAYPLVDSLALHVYLGWGTGDVDFPDDDYYRLIGSIETLDRKLAQAVGLAQAYSTHEHRIDVVVDEWGTWHRQATAETGLYQQNTMQDALFAAACFHCFHKHGNWLWMTNMAQTVNVLQALILTKGPKLVLTPTYHVYEMFRPHRDGDLVAGEVRNSPVLSLPDAGDRDAISTSATVSADGGRLFLSILNLDLAQTFTVDVNIPNAEAWQVRQVRRLATGDIRSHNTFEDPAKVRPEDVRLEASDRLSALQLPPQSITTIQMKQTGK